MCGIVGYVGNRNAQDILIGGLRRLEYRGYDSAGIATLGSSGTTLLRSLGKVEELSKKLLNNNKEDHVGIGHTRWATHGVPSETNAHPHKVGNILLVHNGIVENYKELRTELKGVKFNSDTDSEVLAALVNLFYEQGSALVDSVSQALKLVRGTYGIAVIAKDNPDEIVVARAGSPLIIGVNSDEVIIASDASALIGHTDKAIYLNDGEIAICRAGQVDLIDLLSQPVTTKFEKIESDIQAVQKQGYDHFLLKEIFEQPQTLESTLSGRVSVERNEVKLGGIDLSPDELKSIENIVIVGCGTAYYAGLLSSYYLEQLNDNVTVSVAIASEMRYRSFSLPKNSVALIVSQSGETADTLACLREIKARGVKTIGIVNAVGSTIAREVDSGVYVHAGPEISVASTKAFTSQAVAMIMFGVTVAQAKGSNMKTLSEYIKELAILPSEIKNSLKDLDKQMKAVAKQYAKYNDALFLGRDTLYPVALEGALKLKEISYIHAEGYATGELKHGPIALVDDRFFEIILINEGWLFDKSLSGLAEINARGAHVIAITDSNKKLDTETTIVVKTKLKLLTPLLMNVAQQLFAYYMAIEKGNDVDQPRNLAKSVTVE